MASTRTVLREGGFVRRRAAMHPMLRLSAVVLACTAVASCDMPTPLAPAEPIGTVPNWGADFATPTQAPRSMMGMGMGGAPGEAPALPAPGTPMPGAIKDFSGGDAVLGKGLYTALCARCHGDDGAGGALPGGIAVPALSDGALQARLTDAQMARTIALGKGAMPPFMQELDRDKLAAVIAFVRTMKK